MNPFLLISAALLVPLSSSGDQVVPGTKKIVAPSPTASSDVTKIEISEVSKKIAKELEAKYPFSDWKTVGFCGYKKEPVVHLKVPKFLSWEPGCNLHNIRNGIAYCGPNESPPRLSGALSIDGKERILQVSMEAFVHKKPYKSFQSLEVFDHDWGKYGALLSKKEILLGSHPAFFAEIQDKDGKLPMSIKAQTLIYFSHSFVGGMIYFIETERDSKGERFVWHADRVFQSFIDRIIESFQFKVKVEDGPVKKKSLVKTSAE